MFFNHTLDNYRLIDTILK